MPDAAQFTLALFDSTGLATSVQAPARVPAADAGDSHEVNANSPPREPGSAAKCSNYVLDGDRALARGWVARARDNIVAIRLSKEIEAAGRPPIPEEQAQLLRFVGFGATELAQNCFPLPGATGYRDGWEEIGRDLADAVTPAEYAALQRATQYAHYTPESVVRALWHAAERLGCDNMTNSGIVARVAGDAIDAKLFLPNMATEEFLSCLSKAALEKAAAAEGVKVGSRGKDTRANLIERFKDGTYVHPSALFAPTPDEVADATRHASDWDEGSGEDDAGGGEGEGTGDDLDQHPEDGADTGPWSDTDGDQLPAAAE